MHFRIRLAFLPAFLSCVFLVAVVPAPLAAAAAVASPVSPDTLATPFARQLAPGVRLLQVAIPADRPGGPLLMTWIEVDPKASGVRLESALGQDRVWGSDASRGRETVSSLAGRRGALAGINAAFFPFTGVPIGLDVHDGEMVTEPGHDRTVFWIDRDGSSHFDVLTFHGTVRLASGETAPISGLNRPPTTTMGASELLLYTPTFFSATLPAPGRFEVALRPAERNGPLPLGRDFTADVVRSGTGGGMPLDAGTMVLSGSGAASDVLRRVAAMPGASVTLRLDIDTKSGGTLASGEIREAVTGGPRLLTAGAVTVAPGDEGFGAGFVSGANPRSAVGVTAVGKVLLVAIDGRQAGVSRGVSLVELATRMRDLGCVDAVNLDGGGSTTLTVGGATVNSPSEGAERPVASALLVFAATPVTPSAVGAAPSASGVPMIPVGDTFALPDPGATAVWGVAGGVGYVTQADRRFHATRAGHGSVLRVGGGASPVQERVALTVTGSGRAGDTAGFLARVTLRPDAEDANRAVLAIRVVNAEGDGLSGEPVAVTVSGGMAASATVVTDAKGTASVGILWRSGATMAERTVSVTSPTGRFTAARISADSVPR